KLIELARSAGQQERLSALVVRPLWRKGMAEGEAAPLRVRSSLGSRVWSSLQRGVSRGFSRSP
ncbi:MAG: hypothetical protein KDK70_37155, partial [Myxococcales bacterium]|nr:hypothetical protein [Myxococcales bacterium]